MFSDGKIAEAFSMGRTKSMYMINQELAPFFKSFLLIELNESDIFVFSFDKSLNQLHKLVKWVFMYVSGMLLN